MLPNMGMQPQYPSTSSLRIGDRMPQLRREEAKGNKEKEEEEEED